MPRTVEEIVAQADELAKRFEDFEPAAGSAKDAAPLRAVREAFEDYAFAQKRLGERVSVAQGDGRIVGRDRRHDRDQRRSGPATVRRERRSSQEGPHEEGSRRGQGCGR